MDCGDYDDHISNAMNHQIQLHIKRGKKLCNNNAAPKRGEEGYDPSYKYDYIYKIIVHNINMLSQRVELDITRDETNWVTVFLGESEAGITFRVHNKPGISQGGQTVIISGSSVI